MYCQLALFTLCFIVPFPQASAHKTAAFLFCQLSGTSALLRLHVSSTITRCLCVLEFIDDVVFRTLNRRGPLNGPIVRPTAKSTFSHLRSDVSLKLPFAMLIMWSMLMKPPDTHTHTGHKSEQRSAHILYRTNGG